MYIGVYIYMAIIGLVGFIGSGKGTAADILVKNHGYEKISFASKVKDVAATLFDWPRDLLEGETEESRKWREEKNEFWSEKFKQDFTPRLALQLIGTEFGRRVFSKDIWINFLESKIESNKNYVISDVRFPNEIQWIQEQGGKIIEIDKDPKPEWYKSMCNGYGNNFYKETWILDEMQNVHQSEYLWLNEKINFTVKNNGTIEDLSNRLNFVLTKINDSVNIDGVIYHGD